MTPAERKTRIEDIRRTHEAWRFYKSKGSIHSNEDADYLIDAVEFLLSEIDLRDDALRFYANSENYDKDTGAPIDMKPRGLEKKLWKVLDFGDKAREALGEE